MYYEWQVLPTEDIRFVASGYEDGIDYSFFRISDSGKYELLVRINPIIVDANGRYWWGYPWTIADIVRYESPCSFYIGVTFDHSIVRDGVVNIPDWQKRMPAVLFKGNPENIGVEYKGLLFKPMKIVDLVSRAAEG